MNDDTIRGLATKHGSTYTNRHFLDESRFVFTTDGLMDFVHALLTAQPTKPSLTDFQMGGCPVCGSQSCVAHTCTRDDVPIGLPLPQAAQAVPDRERWTDEVLRLVEKYGDERATKAYHGDFHCRQQPATVLAEIKTMLATAHADAPTPHAPRECWSTDDENFIYETLGDLLDSNDLEPGVTVWRAEAHLPKMGELIDADWVIECIGEQAYDIGGEYAKGYPECTGEQAERLQAMLEQWLSKCPAPRFYAVKNSQPYTITKEDLA